MTGFALIRYALAALLWCVVLPLALIFVTGG
jgi:hypothetical protein